ncbi:MAG: prolipoprotein diacylglyceryl transferase [Pseudomonadota bacterium]
MHYIHNLNPIALQLGELIIPWYWLVYLVGFFYIYFCGQWLIKHFQLQVTSSDWSDSLVAGWVGLFLGARLGYFSLYQPEMLRSDPAVLLRIWAGGMSFHGGIFGAGLAILIVGFWKRKSVWPILDTICTLLPLCLGMGRLANFINGELAGRPTNVPWAVVFPELYDSLPRHPSQIYEALGEGLILGLILWTGRKNILMAARQTALFALSYSIIRFFLEFFREPDPQLGLLAGSLSMGQILCGFFFVLGLILFRRSRPTTRPDFSETAKVL